VLRSIALPCVVLCKATLRCVAFNYSIDGDVRRIEVQGAEGRVSEFRGLRGEWLSAEWLRQRLRG
jgi:hypothetical protein